MLWNNPTIASLTAYLVKRLSPQEDSVGNGTGIPPSSSRVLDELFAQVESAQ
jgi:hypothetical protein